MTTLKQIWIEKGKIYKTPLTGSPLFQKEDIKEWLRQKQIPPKYGYKDIAYKMCKRQLINKFIKELLKELK